jgi:hypothetical protein
MQKQFPGQRSTHREQRALSKRANDCVGLSSGSRRALVGDCVGYPGGRKICRSHEQRRRTCIGSERECVGPVRARVVARRGRDADGCLLAESGQPEQNGRRERMRRTLE